MAAGCCANFVFRTEAGFGCFEAQQNLKGSFTGSLGWGHGSMRKVGSCKKSAGNGALVDGYSDKVRRWRARSV